MLLLLLYLACFGANALDVVDDVVLQTRPASTAESEWPLFAADWSDDRFCWSTETSLSHIHSHWSKARMPAGSDSTDVRSSSLEGVIRFAIPGGRAGVAVLSQFPDAYRYYRLELDDRGVRWVGVGTATDGDLRSDTRLEAGVWYRFEIETQLTTEATELRARVWSETKPKPEAWTVTAVDRSLGRPLSGTVGFYADGPGKKSIAELRLDDVRLASGPARTVELELSTTELSVGDEVRPTARFQTGPGAFEPVESVEFSSSEPAVVKVDARGQLVAVAPGLSQVTAIAADRRSRPIRVEVRPTRGPAASETQSSVERHGITWRFESPRSVGRYVNGDYWVVGPVAIVDIEPGSVVTAVDGAERVRNGTMIDPLPRGSDHGWDSSLFGTHAPGRYKPDLNVGVGVSPATPLRVGPGHSVVSSVTTEAVAHKPPGLVTAAVLSVVAEPPLEDSFRPPYSGTHKPTYHYDQLRVEKLGALPRGFGSPGFKGLARAFERVWLDHVVGWLSRFVHPKQNMPDYGRDISVLIGTAGLLLQVEAPVEEKRPLLIAFVQLGIDLDGLLENGARWPAAGGHCSGRKWPILFKRSMFGEQPWLDVANTVFSEDAQTFVVRETSPGVLNYGHGGYTDEHHGMPEWGEYYWDQSPRGSDGFFAWKENSYRRCCTYNTLAGHFLAAHAMGLIDEWQWDAAPAYMDRYMQLEAGWTRQKDAWTASMWDAHRKRFPNYRVIPDSWRPEDL